MNAPAQTHLRCAKDRTISLPSIIRRTKSPTQGWSTGASICKKIRLASAFPTGILKERTRTLTVPAGTEITYELLAQQGLIRTDLTDEDLHIVPDQNGSYNYVYDAAQESGEAISGFRVFAEDNVIRIYYDRRAGKEYL